MLSECIAQVEKIEEKVEGLQKIEEEEEALDRTQHHYHQLKLL
jgi:hypothetical protein